MADSYRDNAEPLYDQAPGAYMHVEPDEVIPDKFDNPLYFQGKQKGASVDTGYLAVQPDWLSEQWDLLAEQPWFRGFMQREDAVRELSPKSPGNFVVRVSNSEPGHYAISAVQFHGQMDHMLILPSYAGPDSNAPGATRYRLGTYSKLLFNTVPKLIAYYIDHEYIDVRRLQGEVIAENQVGGYMDVNPGAPGWNKGGMSREDADAILGAEQIGAFVARTKGTGFVISQAVPEPKGITHHLVTIQEGNWYIDNVPVGNFRSINGLVDVLMTDTLGVLHCPLVDVFGHGPGPAAGGTALYDSATGAMGTGPSALYDTAGAGLTDDMASMAIYDQAQTDNGVGYLGVEPAAQEATGYLGVEPAQFDQGDPYDENPYGDNGEPYNPYGEVGDPGDYKPQNDVEL